MLRLPEPGPIVIVGAGGFGRECLDIIEALNEHGAGLDFIGFLDDGEVDAELLARRGTGCLGPVREAHRHARRYVIAIGDGRARKQIDESLTSAGLAAEVLVHPQATLGSDCTIAPGVILNTGARVTTNVTLGRHVQVHANSSVGHDARLGAYSAVFPGATISGGVELGEGVTIGTGANVLPSVRVSPDSFVGAGAVVTSDVAAGSTVVGVPARPTMRRS